MTKCKLADLDGSLNKGNEGDVLDQRICLTVIDSSLSALPPLHHKDKNLKDVMKKTHQLLQIKLNYLYSTFHR